MGYSTNRWPCAAKNLPRNWPKLPKPTMPIVRKFETVVSFEMVFEIVMLIKGVLFQGETGFCDKGEIVED